MAFKKLSILPLPGHILHNNKMSRYPRTVLYLASFFVCIFNVKITRVLLICRSIRAIFPRFRSYTGQFSSTSPGMKWQVNINLTFIRLALISLLTYLLKLLYVAPHNTVAVCRAQPARRRRPRRRRARHQQPVDINHRMEQLVATVATQCHLVSPSVKHHNHLLTSRFVLNKAPVLRHAHLLDLVAETASFIRIDLSYF